ncbi:MAG: TRAFAC clade GTPase domain-containing protein, partial [Polyangiaceae bacterium]
MAQERSIVICGLPESGKTTFLAALWHLVTARKVDTKLSFDSLRDGDQTHLNNIVRQWRDAKVQARTSGQPTLVSMNLLDRSGTKLRLTFPDLSGESYRR